MVLSDIDQRRMLERGEVLHRVHSGLPAIESLRCEPQVSRGVFGQPEPELSGQAIGGSIATQAGISHLAEGCFAFANLVACEPNLPGMVLDHGLDAEGVARLRQCGKVTVFQATQSSPSSNP